MDELGRKRAASGDLGKDSFDQFAFARGQFPRPGAVAAAASVHGGEEVRPCLQRKGDQDVGVRQMVLKREALAGGQQLFVAVQMAHEVAFTMPGHAVAEDVVVHAAADIDRIDLHKTELIEYRSDVRRGLIEQDGAAVKTPGQQRGNFERSRQHKLKRNEIGCCVHQNISSSGKESIVPKNILQRHGSGWYARAACGWAAGDSL